MGLYNDRVLPRILNAACGSHKLDPLRRQVCTGLAGEVIEIGFGSGLNTPFYPAGIAAVAAVEPSDVSWELAGERLRATEVPVQRSGLDGQSLPFTDGCHLTRPIVELVKTAGFTIKEVDVFYENGASRVSGADSLGIAHSP